MERAALSEDGGNGCFELTPTRHIVNSPAHSAGAIL